MSKTTGIINPLGDYEENLQRVARVLGSIHTIKWRVFDAVYGRGNKSKTAEAISSATGDKLQSVRNAANRLAHDGIIVRESLNGGLVGYGKQAHVAGMKSKLKRLLEHPEKIERIPTKRNNAFGILGVKTQVVRIPKNLFSVKAITIDEIDSFKKVRDV